MFYAYSFRNNDTICADKATDTTELFGCLNEDCDARFKVKGINSDKATHFAKTRDTEHIPGCPFMYSTSEHCDNGDIIKSDILTIFNGKEIRRDNPRGAVNGQNLPSGKKQKHIRTPKGLLNYCISNRLDTIYIGDITVNDIIIDVRNIDDNENYKGVEGVRLLLGQTLKYKSEENLLTMLIKKRDDTDNSHCLTVDIYMTQEQLSEINRYIFNRNRENNRNRYAGHPIAVLGQWEKVSDGNVKTTIRRNKNVIYKFATERR